MGPDFGPTISNGPTNLLCIHEVVPQIYERHKHARARVQQRSYIQPVKARMSRESHIY
mgnify:CR=1 FL=1